MKLYELTTNYNQLLELAEEMEQEVFLDTLESIQEEIEVKAENVAKLVRNIEADINALKEEEKRLAERRKALESKVSNLKSYLQSQLEFAGVNKIKRTNFTISIQNNPPSVQVENEDIVPSEYQVPQAPKLDKKSLLQALKNGVVIEGCSIKQGQSLRIK